MICMSWDSTFTCTRVWNFAILLMARAHRYKLSKSFQTPRNFERIRQLVWSFVSNAPLLELSGQIIFNNCCVNCYPFFFFFFFFLTNSKLIKEFADTSSNFACSFFSSFTRNRYEFAALRNSLFISPLWIINALNLHTLCPRLFSYRARDNSARYLMSTPPMWKTGISGRFLLY